MGRIQPNTIPKYTYTEVIPVVAWGEGPQLDRIMAMCALPLSLTIDA